MAKVVMGQSTGNKRRKNTRKLKRLYTLTRVQEEEKLEDDAFKYTLMKLIFFKGL